MAFDLYFITALIISVTVHEFTHAWIATYLGDPTAKYSGRLTLNPLAHLDPIGTFMILYAKIGWGKPVPLNMNYLKNPRFDAALIALSGPLSNLALALIFTIPYRYLFIDHPEALNSSNFFSQNFILSLSTLLTIIFKFLQTLINLNLALMIFNILPIPPLDGSKIFSVLIPKNAFIKLYQYRNLGYILLFVLIFSDYFFSINILNIYILSPAINFFWKIILGNL